MHRETIKLETEFCRECQKEYETKIKRILADCSQIEKNLLRDHKHGYCKNCKMVRTGDKCFYCGDELIELNAYIKQQENETLKCHFCGKSLDNTSYCYECLHGVRKEVEVKSYAEM
jgi:hypothetical protein